MLPLGHSTFLASVSNTGAAATWRPITEADSFPAQWEAIIDEDQAQVWDCSRRAAKTAGAIRRAVKRSSERAGWRTLYIHRTRVLAKQQFYETGESVGPKANPGVRELLKIHGIPEAHHDRTELNVRLVNGSFVQAVGCDDARDVDKKLGFRWDDIVIDECQDFDDELLERLVDKTILPTLIDRRGSLTLMGTPPEVELGTWYRATTDGAMKRHHWTLLENPFIRREDIVSIYSRRGFVIDFDNPTNNAVIVQREIFGLHVVDPTLLTYCYSPDVNDYDPSELLGFTKDGIWRFAMGIDIGGVSEDNDSDAVTVLGWMVDDPKKRIWERETWEARGDSEEFVDRIEKTYRQWRPMMGVCGDTGGAGAVKALASFKKRLHVGFEFTPKPSSVELSQRLVNDDFRSGRMRTQRHGLMGKAARLCRRGEHEHDVMASTRYAHHCAYHYAAKAPPPELDRREALIRHLEARQRRLADPFNPYRRN